MKDSSSTSHTHEVAVPECWTSHMMGLTKWSGSDSQTLIAPSIFFLSTLGRNGKDQNGNWKIVTKLYLDSSIYRFIHEGVFVWDSGFHLCAWKSLVPLQDLHHVLLCVPTVSTVVTPGVSLGPCLLLVLDKVILSGKICWMQRIFILRKSGSWNLDGQMYGGWHLESIGKKTGFGWSSPCWSCMPHIGVQASCGHHFSTQCGAIQEPVSDHPFSSHTIFSASLSARSLPWHDYDNGHQVWAMDKFVFFHICLLFENMKFWTVKSKCKPNWNDKIFIQGKYNWN